MSTSPKRKESVTTRNIREQYTQFLNDDAALVEAQRWIERATFTPFKNKKDFRESLADGVLLCELIVNVANISVGRISKEGTCHAAKDNLCVFFRACEALGMEKYQLFDFEDLEDPPIKRGETAADRAKESQKRLGKVALTVYWLGKYAKEELNFTGRLLLEEECFNHLLEGAYPTLPDIEPALRKQGSTPNIDYKPQCEVLDEQRTAEQHKTQAEKVDFEGRRQAFRHLEEQAKQEEEEERHIIEERQRRRSFSGKENKWEVEDLLERRKSIGSRSTVYYREGDCQFKHKREILGGWRDPVRSRRDRILQSGTEWESEDASPKQPIQMKASVKLREKKQQYEAMERQASEEAEVLQGKRMRPKSWAGNVSLRGGSLKDRTLKYDSLQYQADKESAVLHGELRMPAISDDKRSKAPVLRAGSVKLKDKQSKFEHLDKTAQQESAVIQGALRQNSVELYDIGDKPNAAVSLPTGAEIQLQDKKRKFESLDYKAQRESQILKLHSGKSFDGFYADPIPLSTSTRRAEPKSRPKSDMFDYHHDYSVGATKTFDIEMQDEQVRPAYSAPQESGRSLDDLMGRSSPARSLSPTLPSRGDSLRYSPVGFQRRPGDEQDKDRPQQYSSFQAAASADSKDKAKKLNYTDFVVPPVSKQKERVERYNAALEDLAKEPEPKAVIDHATGSAPRRKSRTSTEWIKVTSTKQEPKEQKTVKKLWDREPQQDSDDENQPPTSVPRYGKPAVDVSSNSYEPDVKHMTYRDFVNPPTKVKTEGIPTTSYVAKAEANPPGTTEQFKRFTPPVVEPSRGGKVSAISYQEFAVPPKKLANVTNEEPPQWRKEAPGPQLPQRKRSVKDISHMFTEMETGQDKPKPSGPPPPKSLVDRDELIRYERESRARSWYGGPLGLDDEEYDAVLRHHVRRFSDYDYENSDQKRPSPYDNDSSFYDHQRDDVFETSKPTSPPRSPPTIEQDIKPASKPVVEASREWNSFNGVPAQSGYQSSDSSGMGSYATKYEPRHETSRPVKSILKQPERAPSPTPKPEAVHDYYHVETTYGAPKQQPSPPRSPPTRSPPPETKPETYGSAISAPAPEPEPPARPPLPNYRAIVGRSWQDFETSTRKKSLELLNRPPSRVFDPPPEPIKAEVVKLKRPADYLPRHGSQELLSERATSPTHRPVSPPSQTKPFYQQPQQPYPYESKSSPQGGYPDSRVDESRKLRRDDLPMSYPTYYEPEDRTPDPKRMITVEASQPLIVDAKLRDEKHVPGAGQRRSPGQEFHVAEERQPTVESRPRSASPRVDRHEPKSKLEIGDYAFRPRSPQQHTWQPKPREDVVRTSPPREEPKSKEDRSPQVFAIVGQGKSVRPIAGQIPQPLSVVRQDILPERQSPKDDFHYKKHHEDVQAPVVEQAVHDVSLKMEEKFRDEEANVRKPKTFELTEERQPKTFELKEERNETLSAQQNKNIQITTTTDVRKEESVRQEDSFRSPGHPETKVFDFRSQSPVVKGTEVNEPELTRSQSPRSVNRQSPVTLVERQVVVEAIPPVQNRAPAEVDLSVLEKNQEESLRDADYRAKLRKEMEETNRKQREQAQYLTNQMRASLGSDEDLRIKEEKDRLVREQEASFVRAEETKESVHGLLDDLEDLKTSKEERSEEKTIERGDRFRGRRDDEGEVERVRGRQEERVRGRRELTREKEQEQPREIHDQRSLDRSRDRQQEGPRPDQRPRERSQDRHDERSRERYEERPHKGPDDRGRYDDRSRGRSLERPRDHEGDRSRGRSREASREREPDRSRGRSREGSREREPDRSRGRSREGSREPEGDRSRGRSRERESDRVRGRSREGSRERYEDRNRERYDAKGPRDRPEEKPRDRYDDRSRDGRDDRPRGRADDRGRRPEERVSGRRERMRDDERRGEMHRDRPEEKPRDRLDERARVERPDERQVDRIHARPDERPRGKPESVRDRRERGPPRDRDRRDERESPRDRDRRDDREPPRDRRDDRGVPRDRDRRDDREPPRDRDRRDDREPPKDRRDDRGVLRDHDRREDREPPRERDRRDEREPPRDRDRRDDREPPRDRDRRDDKEPPRDRRDDRGVLRDRDRRDNREPPRDRDRRDERPRDKRDELSYDDRARGRPEDRPTSRGPERQEERLDGDRQDPFSGKKGMEHWRANDINANYQHPEEPGYRGGEMNGISPTDKHQHDNDMNIQRLKDAEHQRSREAEEEMERGRQQIRKEDPARIQTRYGVDDSPREAESKWKRLRDGSEFSIYEAYMHGDRSHVICATCGLPITKCVAVYVSEMRRYWHDHCFQCVVCHVRFGSEEQRGPMKVTNSLLHCENCYITDEGERWSEV